jgi:hypothetical protein
MNGLSNLKYVEVCHYSVLFGAFFACFIAVVFSWPDLNDRKRAIFPHPLKCCEIRIAHWVLMPGTRTEKERLQTAAIRAVEPQTRRDEAR